MVQIRPVSDLRNKYSEIESIVTKTKSPVFLTKNGYGSMVVMSLQMYESLTNDLETRLDEADLQAKSTPERFSHDDVFSAARSRIRT
ncbi:type II toxin-antitoxin system Phd/YefM family antitoxin [Treponema sp.]|uniref:type II toxin-antitoxin system Phd/YefM family antitoxin n=1 Tax=Treponema sp. TaxID=166 RepID=UPI0025FD1CF1|nr:type II toxin-antitoxin system Phd/YefM family antitoxin [Treponema sp.]MBR4321647.1 type II toxin-antitoxin system Phd/YefM family antitoxin [Treponema sp.]